MNEFSLRFLDALRHSGHWAVRAFADRAVEAHDGLRIDGASPAGHPYYITTEGGREVTIGLGRHWHAHFGEFPHGSAADPSAPAEPFGHVVRFLDDLVHERFILTEWYRGRVYLGSQGRVRGWKGPTLPHRDADRRVTLSWAGKYGEETLLK